MRAVSSDTADFTTYGLSCVQWIPGPMQRPDHHNEIQLNIMPRGRVTYVIGGRTVRVQPGHLTAFWAAIPHQIIDYNPDTEYYVATMPLAWFLQCQLPEVLVQPLMRGDVVEEPTPAAATFDAIMFRRWKQDLHEAAPTMREIVAEEMTTRLKRLATALGQQTGGDRERAPARPQLTGLNKLERIVCYIAQNYMSPVTAEDIGRACGMHPNSAMRLFKRTFGTTLVDHLTHHRIFHAKRLLATTDMKIVDIAFSSGFNSISRFNEAFRRGSGCTPRVFRQRHDSDEPGD